MLELQKQLEKAWDLRQPFVAYHLPHTSEVKCMIPHNSKLNYLQHYDEAGFIFKPFKTSSQPIVFHEANSGVFKYDLIDIPKDTESKFSIKDDQREEYLNLLSTAIKTIKMGKAKKIVVSRVISTAYDLQSPFDLLMKLIKNYPTAFTYVWFHPDIGLWAGASPELFAKTYRNRLETMALAGTKNAKESRAWTVKEENEQQIVTDDIQKVLMRYANKVDVSERKTDRAGELLHLRTDLKANFQPKSLGRILEELHPTPAVCGLPKEPAYQFLLENEGYNRQFYTGFLGELNSNIQTQRSSRTKNQENQAYKSIAKASNLFVNLRCLSYSEGKLNIYVGGGITKDSVPEDEWEETVNKSRTMLKVL
jgi:isochorismate synthase